MIFAFLVELVLEARQVQPLICYGMSRVCGEMSLFVVNGISGFPGALFQSGQNFGSIGAGNPEGFRHIL